VIIKLRETKRKALWQDSRYVILPSSCSPASLSCKHCRLSLIINSFVTATVYAANIQAGNSPRYLADIVQPACARVTRTEWHVSQKRHCGRYIIPWLRTKYGEHALAFSGTTVWNSLPADSRIVSDKADFKNKLKTSLFKSAFDILYKVFIDLLLLFLCNLRIFFLFQRFSFYSFFDIVLQLCSEV